MFKIYQVTRTEQSQVKKTYSKLMETSNADIRASISKNNYSRIWLIHKFMPNQII